MTTTLYFLAIGMFLIVCFVLCFVILIQESKTTGLGASFGGETTDSLFGTATADVLKKFTGWMALIFLAACVVLSMWTSAMGRSQHATPDSLLEQVQTD
ncbi:MAG: preprotein translocase subunit SecG [Chlamydiia bacterium]|nr:preprotein translocase subunit SecG [Chlamydiia bacterium]